MNTDRRRINGPTGGTSAPVYAKSIFREKDPSQRATRTRPPNVLRKMFLKTGVTPSASGSAYLELSPSPTNSTSPSTHKPSTLKLTCTVHGPRPLPKSAPFSPHIHLTTYIKHAPFASPTRRGYLRDASERDLSVHLETALRGVIIGDRWPKSGVEVVITVLEGEEGEVGVLSGCITVASAAIADAGIDCVDVVAGGVAALVKDKDDEGTVLVLDPVPGEHGVVVAACVVGYLPGRDEITDLWVKGDVGGGSGGAGGYEELADGAVQAALGAHRVLVAALKETAEVKMGR